MSRSLLIALLALGAVPACREAPPVAPDPSEVSAPRETPAEAHLRSPPSAPTAAELAERDRIARQLDQLGEEGWYGVYMMGKKVGSGRLWFRRSAPGEPGAFTYGFAMKMAVSGGGNANLLTVEELRFYGAEYPYPLAETRFSSTARGFVDERVGRPTADGRMRIERKLGGTPEPEREVAGTHDDLVAQLRLLPQGLSDADLGRKVRVASWSWENEADEMIMVALDAIETRQRAGVSERVGVFSVTYEESGMTGKTSIADGGTLLEMSLGAALTLKLEEREVAEGGVVGLDILGTGLVSPRKLGRPDRIDGLVLEVSGPRELRLPASTARAVEPLAAEGERGRWRLTMKRGFSDAVLPDERKQALESDATIDAGHPSIIARMQALTAGREGARDKVAALSEWVFRTLDKKLATHLPTASMVLDKQVGDCTEHTWLTVALVRAAGIPARPVYGIAYAGDGEAMFAYHAWVEVALADATGVDRWLAIDPTWGEAEADATHLVLGTSLGEVAASIGGLVIEKAEILPTP